MSNRLGRNPFEGKKAAEPKKPAAHKKSPKKRATPAARSKPKKPAVRRAHFWNTVVRVALKIWKIFT